MSMNIGPMIRAMMGDAQPTDARSLELRIGQIVRGVLMELLENQEAIVNINGVQVKAKLEADMPVGKSMLLQVQPNVNGGLLALKPLPDASDAMPYETLSKDLLKSFGLPEQKWSMELLRGLKRDGYPIGKEAASFFQTAAALKPAGVDAASWASSADVAFRRGLKPTETTLSSLKQALFGQPIHEELANLRAAVDSWLGGAKAPSQDAAALGQKLQSLLAQGAALVAEGESELTGTQSLPASAFAKVPDEGEGSGVAPGNKTAGEAVAKQPAEAGKQAPPVSQLVQGARAEGTLPAATEGAAGKAEAQPSAPRAAAQGMAPPAAGLAAAVPEQAAKAATRAVAAESAAADGRRAAGETAAGAQPAAAVKQEAGPWIGRFLQWLGVGHERQLLHAAEARLPGGNAGLDAGGAAGVAPGGAEAAGQEARHAAAETLKGALLALASHDEAPPALREAAQTLANQVTGQQLLLSSDRNSPAPFSHMTMFIPMKGSDGETTATVHVQTRRSRKGEWDTDNCHLLFDLRMRNLGDTLVDVQVVDRIVSLKLLSDFPGMSDLIEQARDELVSGMSTAGFQLLSLSASPLPQWKLGSVAAAAQTVGAQTAATAAVASAYAAKPYKGVDYRA
ncbi:hypothetical protein D7Z26_09625 [Cohnella endophytica]|uniref:Flagellar hook-length control protein FliK n=1 Tax=Cohnella endophytica TaxID=2419778 RepID=A0A494Y0B2_9BACL|nr:hypothetical protein [Cohnella endophytica]RKP55438.1 hypothetical protein D7Z26_09625 [Cohnella endophytica]